MSFLIVNYIIFGLVMAIIPAMIANSKGREPVPWFVYAFLVFPVALVHILLAPHADHIACPFCKKLIDKSAAICPNCRSKIPKETYEDSNSKFSPSSVVQKIEDDNVKKSTIVIAGSYRKKGRQIETESTGRLDLVNNNPTKPQSGDLTYGELVTRVVVIVLVLIIVGVLLDLPL